MTVVVLRRDSTSSCWWGSTASPFVDLKEGGMTDSAVRHVSSYYSAFPDYCPLIKGTAALAIVLFVQVVGRGREVHKRKNKTVLWTGRVTDKPHVPHNFERKHPWHHSSRTVVITL